MTKKRSRLQVIKDILSTIDKKKEGTKPTHILYKSNLSHNMMDDYLTELISKEFIKKTTTKKGKTYSITKKGRDYLDQYKLIESFTESFGLD